MSVISLKNLEDWKAYLLFLLEPNFHIFWHGADPGIGV